MKKTRARKIFNSNGATLIEVMASLGVLGVLILATSHLSSLVSNAAHDINKHQNARQLLGLVRLHLSQADLCDRALTEVDGNSEPVILHDNGNWLNSEGVEISMRIPGLNACTTTACTTMTSDRLTSSNTHNKLPLHGLQIDSLRLYDSYKVDPTPAPAINESLYFGRIILQVSKIQQSTGGKSLRPMHVSPILFSRNNTTGQIKTCKSSYSQTTPELCTQMGCTYNTSNTPPCSCPNFWSGCENPGESPVAVRGGVLFCKPLGGQCPDGSMLTGVAVGKVYCMRESQNLANFALESSTVAEGNLKTIKVRISTGQPAPQVITLTKVDGAATEGIGNDFTVNNYNLTFAAGATEVDFVVQGLNDVSYEPISETAVFRITAVPDGLSIGDTDEHILTISDVLFYNWSYNDWGACSAPCGDGTQARNAYCRASSGAAVNDNFCSINEPKPADQTQACNLGACAVVTTNYPAADCKSEGCDINGTCGILNYTAWDPPPNECYTHANNLVSATMWDCRNCAGAPAVTNGNSWVNKGSAQPGNCYAYYNVTQLNWVEPYPTPCTFGTCITNGTNIYRCE